MSMVNGGLVGVMWFPSVRAAWGAVEDVYASGVPTFRGQILFLMVDPWWPGHPTLVFP